MRIFDQMQIVFKKWFIFSNLQIMSSLNFVNMTFCFFYKFHLLHQLNCLLL